MGLLARIGIGNTVCLRFYARVLTLARFTTLAGITDFKPKEKEEKCMNIVIITY